MTGMPARQAGHTMRADGLLVRVSIVSNVRGFAVISTAAGAARRRVRW